jgi:hypothetical protein
MRNKYWLVDDDLRIIRKVRLSISLIFSELLLHSSIIHSIKHKGHPLPSTARPSCCTMA